MSTKTRTIREVAAWYLTATLGEWALHRLLMHNEGNQIGRDHLAHHRDVQNDMTIERDTGENVYFTLRETVGIFVYAFVAGNGATRLLGAPSDMRRVSAIAAVLAIAYTIAWNTLHPMFHAAEGDPMPGLGLPGIDALRRFNFATRWLFRNHTLHHLIKGDRKGNYNIIIPGADHLFGTYNHTLDNTDFCRLSQSERRLAELCRLDSGHLNRLVEQRSNSIFVGGVHRERTA